MVTHSEMYDSELRGWPRSSEGRKIRNLMLVRRCFGAILNYRSRNFGLIFRSSEAV